MEILNLTQGSEAWHAHRSRYFNASDAPAMLGCSPYKNRSDLLRERATGITPEVDGATQRRFDEGHTAEALARPLAEDIIGEELAPLIGVNDLYSASFDGVTMDGDVLFEHKLLSQRLRDAMHEGCTGADLPEDYRVQMEHQLMVSGAERVLFMASKWDSEGGLIESRHCWYVSDPAMRARIIAGWEQFEQDVATYAPENVAAPVVAAPMESLPAVVVQVSGALTVGGNLDAFGQALRAFIERIPQRPANDQEFADAEAACKALKKAEDALAQAEEGALAQISDVEVMRRTVADLKDLARKTRLATEKLVKAEKDNRRFERVQAARAEFDKHVARLQIDIQGVRLTVAAPDFGGAIKGLSSLASIDDKLAAALIDGKAQASQLAGMVVNNLRMLDSMPSYAFLFSDRQELAHKDGETLELIVQKRVDDHKRREAERLEQERQRIEAEAKAKAEREAQASLEAERARIRAEEQHRAAVESATRARLEAEAATKAEQERAERETKQQQAAPAPAPVHAPVPAPVSAPAVPPADPGAVLTLGAINERLSPIKLDAAGLAVLGFTTHRQRAAVVLPESEWPRLLGALAGHVAALQGGAQ
jgi:putative phage-type endonuclease